MQLDRRHNIRRSLIIAVKLENYRAVQHVPFDTPSVRAMSRRPLKARLVPCICGQRRIHHDHRDYRNLQNIRGPPCKHPPRPLCKPGQRSWEAPARHRRPPCAAHGSGNRIYASVEMEEHRSVPVLIRMCCSANTPSTCSDQHPSKCYTTLPGPGELLHLRDYRQGSTGT